MRRVGGGGAAAAAGRLVAPRRSRRPSARRAAVAAVGAAAERGREAAAHRHVEDDEEAVVGGVGPGASRRPGSRCTRVVVDAVEVPARSARADDAAVPLHRVRVEAGLAVGRAGALAAADAGGLVARPARAGAAVQRGPTRC